MSKVTFSIGDYNKATETIIAGGAMNFPGFVVVEAPKQAYALWEATGRGQRIIVVRSILADDVLRGSEYKDQREVAGEWWRAAKAHLDQCPPGVWLTVGLMPGVANGAECRRFNDFAVAAMGHIATHNLGRDYAARVRPVLGNFSEGTPPLSKWDGFNGFSAMMPALQMCHDMGGALGLQQYWVERYSTPDGQDWFVNYGDTAHAFRHIEVLAESAASIPADMRIIITEFGYAPGDPEIGRASWR